MRVILRSALPRQIALPFSLVFTYSVSLNFVTMHLYWSLCFLAILCARFHVIRLYFISFALWPQFFQQLFFSGLRVQLWRVLRITVPVAFFTWVNKVYHGPGWPTCPCLKVLFCVFGWVVEAKYQLVITKKYNEHNQKLTEIVVGEWV